MLGVMRDASGERRGRNTSRTCKGEQCSLSSGLGSAGGSAGAGTSHGGCGVPGTGGSQGPGARPARELRCAVLALPAMPSQSHFPSKPANYLRGQNDVAVIPAKWSGKQLGAAPSLGWGLHPPCTLWSPSGRTDLRQTEPPSPGSRTPAPWARRAEPSSVRGVFCSRIRANPLKPACSSRGKRCPPSAGLLAAGACRLPAPFFPDRFRFLPIPSAAGWGMPRGGAGEHPGTSHPSVAVPGMAGEASPGQGPRCVLQAGGITAGFARILPPHLGEGGPLESLLPTP